MDGNQEHIGEIKIVRKNCVLGKEDTIYEDDGFFSDVPGSGSMSRSLQALNKYMKKNLLFDDNEDSEEDKAYFTKENSPNDSISKYDSDSVKSNESSIIAKQETLSKYEDSKDITVQSAHDSDVEVTNAAKLTDDYKIKSLLLLDKSVNSETAGNFIEESKPQASVSVANLSIIDQHEKESYDKSAVVTFREKSDSEKNEEKRHTVHDFSDWSNRTNIYPDVYAPLPYSK